MSKEKIAINHNFLTHTVALVKMDLQIFPVFETTAF